MLILHLKLKTSLGVSETPVRVLELENGFYVIGQEMLIAVNSWDEGLEEIRKIKQNEC